MVLDCHVQICRILYDWILRGPTHVFPGCKDTPQLPCWGTGPPRILLHTRKTSYVSASSMVRDWPRFILVCPDVILNLYSTEDKGCPWADTSSLLPTMKLESPRNWSQHHEDRPLTFPGYESVWWWPCSQWVLSNTHSIVWRVHPQGLIMREIRLLAWIHSEYVHPSLAAL